MSSRLLQDQLFKNIKLNRLDAVELIMDTLSDRKIELTFIEQLYVLDYVVKLHQVLGFPLLNKGVMSQAIRQIGMAEMLGFRPPANLELTQKFSKELEAALAKNQFEDVGLLRQYGRFYLPQDLKEFTPARVQQNEQQCSGHLVIRLKPNSCAKFKL